MSWDLDLCTDWEQLPLVPFKYFVKPQAQLSSQSSLLQFPFLCLPVDLQLMVYERCDAPTLFQLMRTCSHTRHPTAKLFWANASTDHWYQSSSGIFEYHQYSHVVIEHCLRFSSLITNLMVDFIRIEVVLREGEQANTLEKAQNFWTRLSKVFPALDKVVLSGRAPREQDPPAPGEKDEDYAMIETLINCAPNNISVIVAFSDADFSAKPPITTLWQAPNNQSPAWQVLNRDWRPTRVLLPLRKWSITPLGDFMTFTGRRRALTAELRGLIWLKNESYDRYAVDGVIHCPYLDCAVTFTERELWRQHLRETDHGWLQKDTGDHMLDLWCYKHTPEEEMSVIEARDQRVQAGFEEMDKIYLRLGYGWGPAGSEQRKYFVDQFTAQLREENFFNPGELTVDPGYPLWLYQDCLLEYFDRTHVYHRCPPSGIKHICYETITDRSRLTA